MLASWFVSTKVRTQIPYGARVCRGVCWCCWCEFDNEISNKRSLWFTAKYTCVPPSSRLRAIIHFIIYIINYDFWNQLYAKKNTKTVGNKHIRHMMCDYKVLRDNDSTTYRSSDVEAKKTYIYAVFNKYKSKARCVSFVILCQFWIPSSNTEAWVKRHKIECHMLFCYKIYFGLEFKSSIIWQVKCHKIEIEHWECK